MEPTSSPSNLRHRHPRPDQDVVEEEKDPLYLDHTPFPKVLEPLTSRITFFFQIWTLKILGTLWLWYHAAFDPQPVETEPDVVKRYPCRPHLPVHIFFPPGHNPSLPRSSSSSSTPRRIPTPPPAPTKSEKHPRAYATSAPLLPLYINIHGGGLTLGNAGQDNTFARTWSTKTSTLVVSLNYAKTPNNPYPTAVNDVVALTTSLLADPTLPIDPAKIVIGGTSAGGLLALSASQHKTLKHKIRAVVAYYPATDFSENPATKFRRRLDKSRAWEALHSLGGALDWGYVPTGHDRRDRFLSPNYAKADQLPPYICVVGAQYDMFCREGRDLIFRVAGKEIEGTEGWKEDWEAKDGKYKWVYARGMPHGFAEVVGRKKGVSTDRKRDYCERLYADIHEWLARNVL